MPKSQRNKLPVVRATHPKHPDDAEAPASFENTLRAMMRMPPLEHPRSNHEMAVELFGEELTVLLESEVEIADR